MFLAHLPASYLLSCSLLALPAAADLPHDQKRRLLITGTLAGILPDLDVLYFYLLSNQHIGHRAFPSHWPQLWLLMCILVAVATTMLRNREWFWHNWFLLSGVQLHFLLDTIAGPIRWLAPFNHTRFTLFHVPRQPGWWVWSYVVHFSAWLEVILIVAAAWLAWHTHRRQANPAFISKRFHSKEK